MLNWAEIEAQEEVADIAANLPAYLQHLSRDGTWVRYTDVNAKGGEDGLGVCGFLHRVAHEYRSSARSALASCLG